MPSIRTFKTFLAVAKHGNFVAAGREIGLTAAAVGLQMRALEEDLQQVLFDRSARAVVLNPAGRKIVGAIEELVMRYEVLVAAGEGGDSGALSGTVVMGALVSTLMGSFADALWKLQQENPRLEVKLLAGMSSEFARQVEAGELDAAVVTRPPFPLPSSLLWTQLYTEPMVLIVPRRPHFPLPATALEILGQCPFIRFDRATWTGRLVREVLDQCQIRVADGIELNSIEAIIELARQGFGVAIVPQLANVDWEHDRDLQVMRLPGVDVCRSVGLLERIHHTRQRFTGAIKQYFGARGLPG
jgi:DNA-binding transcriptional LysR family regulator